MIALALCALLASVASQTTTTTTTTTAATTTTTTSRPATTTTTTTEPSTATTASSTFPNTPITPTTTTTITLLPTTTTFTTTASPTNSSTESTTTLADTNATTSTSTSTTTSTLQSTTPPRTPFPTPETTTTTTTTTTTSTTNGPATSLSSMMTTTSTMPTTPAPTALTPVVWPDVCSDDKCPNTTICVFRVPTVASRSPFTCFNGACNANCKNVLANGGACVLDEDGESNSNSTASTAVANSTATATSDALVCNSTAVAPVVNYPAIAPCSFNEAAKCELCTPTLGSCDRNTDLGDFCTPYEACRTPDTYCLSAGVVVTGSLRCVPLECGVCGGELAACVVEVWNATTAPTFAGCVSTKPGPVLVARAYAPAAVAVWRSARLDLARDFDSAAIVRDMQRLAAVLGGYAEHVRVRNILASNDDSIGDPSLVNADGVSAAGALNTVSVVFQMPAPMLYNLEMLLLVPASAAARHLAAEFGVVGIERTDWVGPVPPSTDAAATLAVALWSVVFFGAIML